MDFREFRYIQTIAQMGSFTKAAEVLYTSQPSLSHLVARIETELGVSLFDRNSKPLRLTYAGEVYLQHAQEILKTNDQMLRKIQRLSANVPEKLVIGLPYERAAYMLPKMVTLLHQEMPELKLEIKTAGVPVLMEMVKKGEIQFAVMPVFGVENWMNSSLIYEEELYLAAAPNMVGPQDLLPGTADIVDLHRLGDKPLVIQKRGHMIRDAIDVLMQGIGISPNVVMEVDGNTAAYRISTAGMGVAIIPQMTTRLVRAPEPHYLYRFSDKTPVTWEVRAIYRKEYEIGDVEQRLFELLREAHQQDNFTR